MRIAFIGTVEGSAIGLKALVDAGMAPGLVLTLPPEAARRHSDYVDLGPLAKAGGSALVHVTDVNGDDAIAALTAFETDLVLVIGWSQVCRAPFMSVARVGNVGFHPAIRAARFDVRSDMVNGMPRAVARMRGVGGAGEPGEAHPGERDGRTGE